MSGKIAGVPSSHLHVFLPVGLGTCLSLLGDTALYTVLPTHTAEAGVALATVGILLSANRWIRLLLNGPAGALYDRLPRRRLFVPALFLGALSTTLYITPFGFWPLFLGRLLWGIAWVGIWIGGNTIILDISDPQSRGRLVGAYNTTFFLGAAAGALLGGIVTDLLGYRATMLSASGLTLVGALVALVLLPETRESRPRPAAAATDNNAAEPEDEGPGGMLDQLKNRDFLAALALLGSNRLVIAGFLLSTFAIYIAETYGKSVHLARLTLGATSLTGIMLSINALVSMVSAPVTGNLSDRARNRWRTAAAGLLPGISGFSLLGVAASFLALLGVPLAAVTSGSNQSLSITLTEESGSSRYRGRRLGILFTVGDLGSAIGPPLAYALIPAIGVHNLYLLAAVVFAAMLLLAWWQSRHTWY